MKTLVRAAFVLAGATGICIAFSLVASADVGNPASAYRSALKIAMASQSLSGAEKALTTAGPPVESKTQEVAPTPAPEQVVIQAPVAIRPRGASRAESVVVRVAEGAGAKYQEIESFFGRVASAGHEGAGSGAGVPALVLALVSAVAVLDRHRLRASRWATDESALELLYARELTPPG